MAVYVAVVYTLASSAVFHGGRLAYGISTRELIGLVADLGGIIAWVTAGIVWVLGVSAFLSADRALRESGFKPLSEVMARGPKRPTVLEHGRPPRPDAWEGPAGYLVSRPELRDRIAKFIEDAADGAVCLVIGDWGTGKTVVACEVGHYLLTHRPRRAIYHAYIDRVGDPDRAHEAVDALSKWLRRWPVPRFYHRRPLLVLEDLHRDLRAATDVVPRLVDDAGALILSTTRSERKDAGEEVRGSAGGGGEDGDVLLLASGREVPLPLQLCRLAKDSGRCLPIELTRSMYEEMAPKVVAKLLGPAKLLSYVDREREEWIRLSQCSLLFVAAMARAAANDAKQLPPDQVFAAALGDLHAVLLGLDPLPEDHARARLVVACALVYGLEETPVHEDFLVHVSGGDPSAARGRLEKLATEGVLVRWPSEDLKHWYGLPHAGVAELVWRLVALREGQSDSLLTGLRELFGGPQYLSPAVRRNYLTWLSGEPGEVSTRARESIARSVVVPWGEDEHRQAVAALPVEEVPESLVSWDDWDRMAAGYLLAWIRDPEYVEALARLAGDDWAWVVHAAGEALGRLGAIALDPCLRLLAGGERSVQEGVCIALGRIGDPSAVEPLVELLGGEDSDARWWAAEALGEIGDARALPGLERCLEDEGDSEVAVSVRQAIDDIRSRQGPAGQ